MRNYNYFTIVVCCAHVARSIQTYELLSCPRIVSADNFTDFNKIWVFGCLLKRNKKVQTMVFNSIHTDAEVAKMKDTQSWLLMWRVLAICNFEHKSSAPNVYGRGDALVS